MRAPPIAIGDTIAEKYVVERVIGEGGMGIVLAARHRDLDQRVAVKCLLPEIAQRDIAAERFRREARAVANMRSEHLCRVLDVGTLANGVPYMIMEYLEGCDLAQELERRGRIPYGEAVDYILQACEALGEAHRGGVIHRDLKPANLFLERRANGTRRVKVLDFGVSKSLQDAQLSQPSLTRTANLVGSPLYMSPEQLESARDLDARVDVWGLGVVLFELISGQPPFSAASIPQLVAAVLSERTPKLPPDIEPSVPPQLTALVARALSKDRNARPSSMDELAEALEPYAAPAPAPMRRTTQVASVETPLVRPQPAARPPTPLSWDRQSVAPAQRVRRVVGIALLLAGAVAGVVAYWQYRSSPGHAQNAQEEAREPRDQAAPTAVRPQAARPGEPQERPLPARTEAQELPIGAAAPVEASQPSTSVSPAPAAAMPSGSPTHPPAETAQRAEPLGMPRTSAAAPAAPPVVKVPIKPAPAAPNTRLGAPPTGQVSDFGGRR
jgi:serine/threonine-protein kinase